MREGEVDRAVREEAPCDLLPVSVLPTDEALARIARGWTGYLRHPCTDSTRSAGVSLAEGLTGTVPIAAPLRDGPATATLLVRTGVPVQAARWPARGGGGLRVSPRLTCPLRLPRPSSARRSPASAQNAAICVPQAASSLIRDDGVL
jgi:hypothetical protein